MTEPTPYTLNGIDPISFEEFEEEGYSVEDALDLAQGLMEDAIPCLPKLVPQLSQSRLKVIKFGILEMAKYIRVDFHNFNDATSPFQSETIGSYSYSKYSSSVKNRESTGVPAFDRAVATLAHLCEDDIAPLQASTVSEQVFPHGFDNFRDMSLNTLPPVRTTGHGRWW